jgi:hypothetical protein
MRWIRKEDVLASFGTGIASRVTSIQTEMLAEILLRLERIEAAMVTSRPRCGYPGCTIVDPPNGGHSHSGWFGDTPQLIVGDGGSTGNTGGDANGL